MKGSQPLIASVILVVSLAACAQLGGKEGGGENLPNRGIQDYDSVGTLSLSSSSTGTGQFSEPTALLIDSKVHLYALGNDNNNAGSVFLFVSEDDGRSFAPGTQVATAPEAAQGNLGAPSLSCLNNQCVLAASVGELGAIHLADGPPEGPFVWRSTATVEAQEDYELGGISSPSVVMEQDSIKLYYTAQADEDEPSVIAGGVLLNDSFERWGVLLTPATGCSDSSGNSLSCWNEIEISNPEVKLARTGTGRTIYRMFFTGNNGDVSQVGFAASFDGRDFETYMFNPVLIDGENQVSNIRVGDSYLMYYVPAATWDAGKIGLSINERGNATETF